MSVGVATEDTAGVATSMILSAISANLSKLEVSGVEARTILTLAGSLCMTMLTLLTALRAVSSVSTGAYESRNYWGG